MRSDFYSLPYAAQQAIRRGERAEQKARQAIGAYARGFAAGRDAAAEIVDQCNREGPYNAIGAASRIRELKP